VNNLYPFGMLQPGRTYPGSGGGYRWGYNGAESNPEVNSGGNEYSTYFRQYDARLGRWLSIDPLRQPGESPYAAMGNNPIVASDPRGDSSGTDEENPDDAKGLSDGRGNPKKPIQVPPLIVTAEKPAGAPGEIGGSNENEWWMMELRIFHNGEWIPEAQYDQLIKTWVDHWFDRNFDPGSLGFYPQYVEYAPDTYERIMRAGRAKWGFGRGVPEGMENPFFLGANGGVEENTFELVFLLGGVSKIARSGIKAVFEWAAARQASKELPMMLRASATAPKSLPLARVIENKTAGDAMRDVILKREFPALREYPFNTVGGRRISDVVKLEGMIESGGRIVPERIVVFESKVGYTSLTSRVRQELARDWWILRQGQADHIIWEFSRSAKTGAVGPSGPLLQKLQLLGIEVRINPF